MIIDPEKMNVSWEVLHKPYHYEHTFSWIFFSISKIRFSDNQDNEEVIPKNTKWRIVI